MALNFNTTKKPESSKDYVAIAKDMDSVSRKLSEEYSGFRIASAKFVTAKQVLTHIDRIGSVENYHGDERIVKIIDSIRTQKPNHSLHDIYVGIEGVLEDYAKKVTTFAQSMVSTVKQYSGSLFDLVVKKLRINKAIDTSKFVQIDTSMRMVLMTYGDYVELGETIGANSVDVDKQIKSWFSVINTIKKQMAGGNTSEARETLGQFVKNINASILVSYLKYHGLIDLEFDMTAASQPDGSTGLVKVSPSKRFNELEQSRLISESGWTDVDKIKNAKVLKDAETISKSINGLYKTVVDFMDESRRISNESCVKEPYICASLIKYSSLLAQMINVYVKAYDMCWTTCLRVCQACMIEQ